MVRKALLVGINDYAPVGPSGRDLHGCVNDARDIANTLVICGFDPGNIRILTDQRATKANIIASLGRLISTAAAGDSLVFYYSGHGSQVPSFPGDGDHEPDGQDEILCPHDLDWTSRTYVTDDDLRTIIGTLPANANLEVVFDSCHSGTATRELSLSGLVDELPSAIRYLPPPFDLAFHIEYLPNLPLTGLLKGRDGSAEPAQARQRRPRTGAREVVVSPGLNHTLWAACRDNQVSEEVPIAGSVRGVFTYHFCQILRRTNGNITRKKLDSLLSAALRRDRRTQVPQLETASGNLDKNIFSK